jgi:hypothetical protein
MKERNEKNDVGLRSPHRCVFPLRRNPFSFYFGIIPETQGLTGFPEGRAQYKDKKKKSAPREKRDFILEMV